MDAEQAQTLRGALAQHRAEFHGIDWRPRRLVDTNVVSTLLEVVTEFVSEVLELPLEGLPTSGRLMKYQKELQVAYEQIRRNRLYNQAEFFQQNGLVFELVGKVFEDLARLERMGHLDPSN